MKDIGYKFTGLWIPKYIAFAKDISPFDAMLWSLIKNLNNDELDGSPISNNILAESTETSVATIKRSIKKLQKRGILKSTIKETGKYKTNRILKAIDREPTIIITRRAVKSSAKKTIADEVVDYWNSKGPRFTKAKHTSETTKTAKRQIEKLFRKHRTKIFEVIDKAYKHMSNHNFIYFKGPKINIQEFLIPNQWQRDHKKIYWEIKSWWDVFLGYDEETIYQKFYTMPKDKNSNITEKLTEVWIESRTTNQSSKITPDDKRNLIWAAEKINKFRKINEKNGVDIIGMDIYPVMKNFIMPKMKGTKELNYESTWTNAIPQALIEYGTIRSHRDITTLE